MNRKLTITRVKSFQGMLGKWLVKIDGQGAANLNNGETLTLQIDERSHQLEIYPFNAFGGRAPFDTAPALIMAGRNACHVNVSALAGLARAKIVLECSYEDAALSEADFVECVARCMVNIFNGSAILERLDDPNNRRKDLQIVCAKDGVHIRWSEVEPTHWSLGYGEEVVPYEAAEVTMPKEKLTQPLLDELQNEIIAAILRETRFEKNKYGCLALNENKKSRLY